MSELLPNSDTSDRASLSVRQSFFRSLNGTKVIALVAMTFALIALVLSCSTLLREDAQTSKALAGVEDVISTCPASSLFEPNP